MYCLRLLQTRKRSAEDDLNEHFSFSCRSNVRYATKVDSTRASQKSAGYVLQLDRSRKRGDRNHQARRARLPEHRSLASPWTRWRCGNSVARLPATDSEKYELNPRSLSLTFARTDLMGVAHDGGTHFRSSSTAATRWVTALRMTSASSSASALTRLRKQPSASAITSSEDAAERC
jgi:hypothetical protein